MKISKLIQELFSLEKQYGDVEVYFQEGNKQDAVDRQRHEYFFIVDELYGAGEDPDAVTEINIRTWPY